MRTCSLLIEKEVGTAKLGKLIDENKAINDLPLNQLTPYVSTPEDIEVIIQNENLLSKDTMLEFNGFRIHQILEKARNMQETLSGYHTPYSKLISNHPSIISFPCEVIWLSHSKGMNDFKDNIEWVLTTESIDFEVEKAKKFSSHYYKLIGESKQKYEFWTSIINKFEKHQLSKLLIDITIELAIQSKMKCMAGLVPIIDPRVINSISLSHKINIAYGKYMDIRSNHNHEKVPKYFYTIALNSSMLPSNDWTDELDMVVKNANQAIMSKYFDGIYVSVRGLSRISNDKGKVSTLSKLVEELNKISYKQLVPIWWSRFGLIGLRLLDMGANYSSYSLNMGIEDVYSTFASNKPIQDSMQLSGKILEPLTGNLYDYSSASKLKEGVPAIDGFTVPALDQYKGKPSLYRKEVVKPYNIAAMNHLNKKWLDDVDRLEINPGAEYLQRFNSHPIYRVWSPN